MELAFYDSLSLSPKLNQQQIQFLSLLKMCESELQEFMEKEMLENPMLDISNHHTTQNINFHNWYRNTQHTLSSSPNSSVYSSYDSSAWLNLVKTDPFPPLHQIVWEQLDLSHCSQSDIITVTYLIDSLDEKGFLPYTTTELSQMSGIAPEQIDFWVTSLKELEPEGIFTYDVADCLKLQLSKRGQVSSLAYVIVENYFDLFIAGRISPLAKKLHTSTASVRSAFCMLTELTPYPEISGIPQHTPYIIPDIIIKNNKEKWEISLNDSWYENYSLCDYYYQLMLTTSDQKLLEYLKAKYQKAQTILENIAHRRQTLILLTEKITLRQDAFLRQSGPLLPLTMSELAEEMNLNTSTISRAVSGKYVQTPRGILLMKDFFHSGYQRDGQNNSVSSDNIIRQMKTLIQSEDSCAPYSDQQLADHISSDNNIKISRRTIAKYREKAGIPSTRKRRL